MAYQINFPVLRITTDVTHTYKACLLNATVEILMKNRIFLQFFPKEILWNYVKNLSFLYSFLNLAIGGVLSSVT